MALLAVTAVALLGVGRRLFTDRRRSEAKVQNVPDLLQLPPLRRRSRDPEYPCSAYLDGSEGGFVDAVRRWRTRLVLGSRASSDALPPTHVGGDLGDVRAQGVVMVVGIGPAAPTRVAGMNLALALGQLSRTLFIDASGGVAPPVPHSVAPSDVRRIADAPEYWPNGMIHRWSLPQFMRGDPAERWAGLAAARQQFDWVVLDVGGGYAVAEVLGGGFPSSATVALVSGLDVAGVDAACEACRSALSDPRQLDGVVVVN